MSRIRGLRNWLIRLFLFFLVLVTRRILRHCWALILHIWRIWIWLKHRWLTNINSWRVIRIKQSKLLLEAWALDRLIKFLWCSLVLVIPYIFDCHPKAPQKFHTPSFHKPYFKLSIIRNHIVERFRCSWQIVCSENRLVELLFKCQSQRNVKGFKVRFRQVLQVDQDYSCCC